MAQLINGGINIKTLKTMISVLEKKNKEWFNFTISINDEVYGNYNQNVRGYASQSQEDQNAKKDKFYFLNGKTVWSNKGEFVAPKEVKTTESHAPITDQEDPF